MVHTEDYKLLKLTTDFKTSSFTVDAWNKRNTNKAILTELNADEFLFYITLELHGANTDKELKNIINSYKKEKEVNGNV